MKQIIQNVQDRLTQDVPALKYVDQDWGQMDFFPGPPVKFPCALIDVQSAQYTNNGNFIQQGTAMVVIRLFDIKLSNSSQAAPAGQKENAKKIWQLIEDVNKALHGQNFLQEGYGLPVRTQMRRTKRNDGCYQTELYYTVQFTDTTCQPELTPVSPVAPELKTVSFLKP
jgi:hypothetical protein